MQLIHLIQNKSQKLILKDQQMPIKFSMKNNKSLLKLQMNKTIKNKSSLHQIKINLKNQKCHMNNLLMKIGNRHCSCSDNLKSSMNS